MLASYRQVLSQRGAARLFASGLLARLPQGTTSLAILLMVRGATHSYTAAGVAVGGEALGTALSAPVLGRLIDAHGRRAVLARAVCGYALALWLLAAVARLHGVAPLLVALAALAGAMMPPVAPALRALLPEVFAEASVRERAYALEAVAQELIWIVGPLLVAALTAFLPAGLVLALIGLEAVLGVALFLASPLTARAGAAGIPERPAHVVLRSGALRGLLVPVTLTGLALGAIEVGLPAVALHAGARAATGLLLALWSVGSMAGGLAYGSRHWRASLQGRYALLLLAAAACAAPLLVAHSLAAAIPLSLLTGVTVAPVFSCQYALVGRLAPAGAQAEAFTWVAAGLVVGIAAGSAAGGALTSGAGQVGPFALSCASLLLAAAIAAAVVWRPSRGRLADAAGPPTPPDVRQRGGRCANSPLRASQTSGEPVHARTGAAESGRYA